MVAKHFFVRFSILVLAIGLGGALLWGWLNIVGVSS